LQPNGGPKLIPHVFCAVQQACAGKPVMPGQVESGVPGVVVKHKPIESSPHPFGSPEGQHAGKLAMPGMS
jgi:hypothetical protein